MTDAVLPECSDAGLGSADPWAAIRQLVSWLDQKNGLGDHETAMRLMKLGEEVGETMQAYIGVHGQNPRKGVTHTPADVADELCDVIVTAMIALHRFTPDPEQHLAAKLRRIAARSAAVEAQEVRGEIATPPQP